MNGVGQVKLSIVVPMYNEEENVSVLSERLFKTLETVQEPWEVIFVNDGSIDLSLIHI